MLFLHKILVVDDEEKIRKSLSGLLEDEGYDVATAGSGPECLQILSSQHIDLVILDVIMPDISGIEALQEIREKFRDTEVIIISGYADKEKAIAAFRLGAYDLIEKPFEAREILNTIANCLNQLQLRRNVEKMTKELASERERLLVTLRSIGDGVIATDIAGKIALMNKMAEKLTGWTEEEAIGRPYSDIFHIINEKTRKEPENRIAKVIKTGLIAGLANHTVLVARDGTERIIADSGAPIKDGDGNIIGVALVFRDITERKQAEEELRESEEKFRAISNTAVDAILLMDNEGKISYWNRAAEQMFGYMSEEALGKELHLFLAPVKYHDAYRSGFSKFKGTGHGPAVGATSEFLAIKKDGTEFPIEVSTSAIKIKGQWNAAGIIRDLTERKKAENFIKNILESVDEGFIVVDWEYRVISANKAYCNQMKMTAEDIIGRKCYDVSHHLTHPCYEAGEICPVRHTLETGEPCAGIHTHFDKDRKPIYIELKTFPMKDTSGKLLSVIEIHNDITEKKKLEAQLLHALKMEAIGTLTSGVAHEFNNILTAIIGYGKLLHEEMNDDDPLRHYVNQILASSERAANLVHDMLAFCRGQIINPIPTSLNRVLKKIEMLLLRVIGEDIELKTILTDEDLIVNIDSGQIEQVVMNLVTNARDAMPNGGSLTISTGLAELAEELKMFEYQKPGKYVLISISDTGTGMDEATIEKIFEPFFTTKDVGKGTGLGLSMVYGIIKQHKGYIHVYSELRKGTTFRIYLPIAESKSEETKLAVSAAQIGGTETIILAEDDQVVRELTKTVLEGYGYNVIEAVDGEDAINKFIDNKDRTQLLIFDLIMPKKSGKDAYDEIKKIRPDVKAIFTSGYAIEIITRKGLLEEGFNFISKPISPKELITKVRKVLDK